jgi:sugar phosphate isomerase/epimerase
MKLAGSNYGTPELPLDPVLEHCARLGYLGAEIAVQPEYPTAIDRIDADERANIVKTFQRHGLECSLICHYGGVGKGPENEAVLRQAIDLSADLAVIGPDGTPPPVTTTALGPPEVWGDERQHILESAWRLCCHAEARGVPFSMKAHAFSAVDRPYKLIWLVEQIDSPAFGLNVDMSHFEVNGLALQQAIPALMPYANHVHLKSSRGRYPDCEYALPGEGETDFVSYLRIIQASGFTGYLSVEVSVFVQRRPDYDPLGALTTCFTVLSEALDEAGIIGYSRQG